LSVLLFCSLTNLALTLSRLSLRRGIDKQQTREQRGGERKVGLRVGVEVCPGRNSKKKERLERSKTNDFNFKKTDPVIKHG
jgi:hypothetical protein